MSIRASVFVGTSLDGFIARPDGNIDWLNEANAVVPPGEDCGYAEFMESVDVLVMGRNTFDQVLGFEAWPYGSKPVVVLSHRPLSIPAALATTVTSSAETPRSLVDHLSAEGANHLYIDGGLTIQSFLAAGLIDDITITVVPILLGVGRRAFGPLDQDVRLCHVATRTYDFGFVQIKYHVMRTAAPPSMH